MKKTLILVSILFVSVWLMFSSPLDTRTDDNEKRLNVLLITIDTLRADRLSCYDKKHVKTPNIDRLAEKGTLFTRAFAHNPLTLPSHANILLGATPLYHGVHDNVNFVVKQNFLTMAEHLKVHGYSTGAVVAASPLDSRFGLNQGFDFYDDEFKDMGSPKFTAGERKADVVVDIAQEWLEEQEGPWFLWMHIWDPHFPYEPPEPYLFRFINQPYNGEVAYVDSVLGSFFQFMEDKMLSEQTLVVFTSDHGESLGQHGERTHGVFAYNTTIWVPLIVFVPGQNPGKIDQTVSHTDIFPSICDILGIEKPSFLQGLSVLPALEGKKLPERRIYFESLEPYYNFGWAPLRGYVDENEKYFDSPISELYFLDSDFEEIHNQAAEKNLKIQTKKLSQTVNQLTNPENIEARRRADRDTLNRLEGLGYFGNPVSPRKENFGPGHDVKTLLPYYNSIVDAYTLREEGKIEKGIEQLQEIIQKQHRVYFAYTFLAKLYRESGQIQNALDTLKQGLEIHPLCYEIISQYSEYLLEARLFDTVIDILSSNVLIRMEHDALLWNYLGLAHMNRGDQENAINAFEMAVSVDPEYGDVYVNLGNLYFSRFLRTKERDAYSKAIHNYKKAIEVRLDSAEAFNGLGAAYMQVGRVQDAIYLWEVALILEPNLTKTYYYLGLAYLSQHKNTEAYTILSTYKAKTYNTLPFEEQRNLEYLIRKAKAEMR